MQAFGEIKGMGTSVSSLNADLSSGALESTINERITESTFITWITVSGIFLVVAVTVPATGAIGKPSFLVYFTLGTVLLMVSAQEYVNKRRALIKAGRKSLQTTDYLLVVIAITIVFNFIVLFFSLFKKEKTDTKEARTSRANQNSRTKLGEKESVRIGSSGKSPVSDSQKLPPSQPAH